MSATDADATSAAAPSTPAGEPIEPSDSFPDRLGEFHLIRKLGSGPTGVVYLARQESLSRDVALKAIRPDFFQEQTEFERFLREVEQVSRLSHPGVVPVYAAGEEGDVPWIAMEVVEGCSLAEALAELRGTGRERSGAALAEAVRLIAQRKAGRATGGAQRDTFGGSWVQCCVRIVRDVARALDHAHRRGVLHRDVNPSNIVIDLRGRARLVDFGLASPAGDLRLPRLGTPLGSLPYHAPEQMRRRASEVDARTDVYSLGVTLYELLALELPYFDADPRRTRDLVLEGEALPLHELVPGIPWDVETVCLAAMERDRERRYPSAETFARELESILSMRPIETRRASAGLRARRWIERHALATLAGVAAFVLSIAAPTAAWMAVKGERDQLAAASRLLQQQADRAQAELDRERERTKSATEHENR